MDLEKGLNVSGYDVSYRDGYFYVDKDWCRWIVYPNLSYMTITGSKETFDDSVMRFIKIYMEEHFD